MRSYIALGETLIASFYKRRGTFCARDTTVTCFRFSIAYVRGSPPWKWNKSLPLAPGNYRCRVKVNSARLLTLFSHCLRRENFQHNWTRSPELHWISTKSRRTLLKGCALQRHDGNTPLQSAQGPSPSKCNFAKLQLYFSANQGFKLVIPITPIAAK